MKKSEWAPAYDRLRPFIEDAAQTHFEGDVEKGFKLWAVKQVLMDTGLSDDALKDPLELDGKGDLGLDGYYEDEEDESLILLQSKFHNRAVAVGNDDLNRFYQCLTKVLNPQVVVASKNALAQDAHRAVRDAIERGWTLRFVFVTTGYLSPEGRTFADTTPSQTETIDSAVVRKELDVYDLEGLDALYQSHLSPTRLNTDVELSLTDTVYQEGKVGDFRVCVAALPARELVRAFRQHGYALFKLNPRGPLQNRVNSNIRKTLNDETKRKWFFQLNNGITALCEGFQISGDRLAVRDFQIVNGCQTTVTLWKAAPIVEADPAIKVLVRLMEGMQGLRTEIAQATNTQARLSAQDFRSNDPLQQDLKNQFDALPEPIFYEVKRGDWEMATTTDPERRKRYQEGSARIFRRVSMVDIAQATLAFLGEPGDAKDKARTIFENDSRYKKVFPMGVRAQQLLLPWRIYQVADRTCRAWIQFSGATYARFCLTSLVGQELCPEGELPSVQEASRYLGQQDRVRKVIRRGQEAIVAVHAAMGESYPGHREFFRSADFYVNVRRTFSSLPS